MDRRGAARDRSAGCGPAHGDGLPDGEPPRHRDAPLPGRRDHAAGARESGRDGAGVELVHARARPDAEKHGRHSPPLSEVRGARQQPRLLHGDPARDREYLAHHVPGVVPPDHVQPSPDGPLGHRALRTAVPGPAQPQRASARDPGHPGGGHRDASAARVRGQAGRDHAPGRQLFRVVQRQPAHDQLLPQHDRHPDRDAGQPDPDAHPVRARPATRGQRSARADRASGVAFPAVGRLLDHQQPSDSGLRVTLSGDVAAQPLSHGARGHRARQRGLVDHQAQAGRESVRRAGG